MPPSAFPDKAEGPRAAAAAHRELGSPQNSTSKRRARVGSDGQQSPPGFAPELTSTSRTVSTRPEPKRFKPSSQAVSPSPTTATPMSAKMKGKMPEVVDLTQQTTFRPSSGAKKLVIKNLRPAAADDRIQDYYDRTRQELKASLEAIFQQKPSLPAPLERLYRGVEDTCRNGQAKQLHRTLSDMCTAHLQTTVWDLIHAQTAGSSSHVAVLSAVLEQWRVWNKQVVTIRSVFSYLDRAYLLREKSLRSINDMAITSFRRMTEKSASTVAEAPLSRSLAGICLLVEFDRLKDSRFDAPLLRESITMINVLNLYHQSFEPSFIQSSSEFFVEFAKEKSRQSHRDYILACEKLLDTEDYRCNAFNFDSSTKKQLLQAARGILVKDYSDKLINDENLSKLLADGDVDSMKALYDLLRLSGIQKRLKEPWSAYIQKTGGSIVGDTDRGDEMVIRLLEHRRSLDLMVRDAFRRDDEFAIQLRQAFSSFMNDSKTTAGWTSGTSKAGEMIAKHIDMLLRGGLKTLPKSLLSDSTDRTDAEKSGLSGTGDEEAELDRQLDQALELFRFIEGKDAFEAFYKKDLARRLLMNRSASSDAERNMLRKLRDECGNTFTRNLEQMFKDQELAKGEMEAYKEWIGNSGRKPAVDLSVMVISAASWPSYPDVKLNVPDEVASEVKRFEGWYKTKHDGRKLTWPHSLANCTVKATFPKGVKELSVSAYQAVVLVLFNSVGLEGALSYEQISAATGLQGPDLERTLQSLACAKVRPLTKHPKGREINKTDTFTVNKTFSDPKFRIKINQIQLKETKEENDATHERINQDRRFETQAAIVRVMKSRKTMAHAELVAEVINLTRKRGPVDAAMIKKEIEALIDKDYLEREGRSYSYVA